MRFSPEQYQAVTASLSAGAVAAGSIAVYTWMQVGNLNSALQIGPSISVIVTIISAYAAFGTKRSWETALTRNPADGYYVCKEPGRPLNDSGRYTDWIVTVPLLLIELVVVMDLPSDESNSLITRLAIAAVIMIATGYPGEQNESVKIRMFWFCVSTIPFLYIVNSLVTEMGASSERQPANVQSLLLAGRTLTVISWMTYPLIYVAKGFGLEGPNAVVFEQVAYTVADIIAKGIFGMLIWAIAVVKSNEADALAAA